MLLRRYVTSYRRTLAAEAVAYQVIRGQGVIASVTRAGRWWLYVRRSASNQPTQRARRIVASHAHTWANHGRLALATGPSRHLSIGRVLCVLAEIRPDRQRQMASNCATLNDLLRPLCCPLNLSLPTAAMPRLRSLGHGSAMGAFGQLQTVRVAFQFHRNRTFISDLIHWESRVCQTVFQAGGVKANIHRPLPQEDSSPHPSRPRKPTGPVTARAAAGASLAPQMERLDSCSAK